MCGKKNLAVIKTIRKMAFFQMVFGFGLMKDQIIGVKVCSRQTERQTDRKILCHHIQVYVDFFFLLNLLPPYSLGLQGDYFKSQIY